MQQQKTNCCVEQDVRPCFEHAEVYLYFEQRCGSRREFANSRRDWTNATAIDNAVLGLNGCILRHGMKIAGFTNVSNMTMAT